jgi:hypothetical protein
MLLTSCFEIIDYILTMLNEHVFLLEKIVWFKSFIRCIEFLYYMNRSNILSRGLVTVPSVMGWSIIIAFYRKDLGVN